MATSNKTAVSAADPIANFNAGFYNAFVASLKLDPTQFQLTQGAFALPTVSTSLYNVFDGVPPASVCSLWTANSLNTVSGNVESLMGYASTAETQAFPYKVAYAGFMNTANWVGGTVGSNPLYAPTVSAISQALVNGSSATVNYDSSTADTSLEGSWSQSSSSGGVWFWGYNSDSTSQSLNTAASGSDVTVVMNISYATVPIQQGPWYNAGYVSQMYKNQNTTFWGDPSEWDTLFGSTGSFQYVSAQALIVNDFEVTVTSKASYSADQYTYVSSNSNINVWPFYTSSSSSSTTTNYSQNADGSITATIKSNPGAVQIMGFNVISLQKEMTT